MKHPEHWRPSKFIGSAGGLRASRQVGDVGIGSRLVADAVAEQYGEHLPRYARGRLIDLGCGSVPLYGAYHSLVGSVTCADWPASAHNHQHVDVQCDLGRPLPFADASFDTIILSDVLEHIPEPAQLWSEMRRILAPQGAILLNVPFMYWLHEVPHDYYRYTEHALRRFAEREGLRVEVLVPIGGAAEILADVLGKSLCSLALPGRLLARLVVVVASVLRRTSLARRLAARSGQRMPLGYFLVVRNVEAPGTLSPGAKP